jgi:PmbA protein
VDTTDLAKHLLGLMEKSGVDQGEVYLQRSEGLEISLRDQEVERLRQKDQGGFALRLIIDNRMAFVHSSDLREESLRRAVEQGVELARAAAPDESNVLPQPGEEGPQVETFDQSIDDISFDRKLALLRDVETMSFAYDPLISKIEYLGYEDTKLSTVIANTNGVFCQGRSTRFSVSLSVVAEDDGSVETGEERTQSRFYEDLDPPSKIATRAAWKAVSLLGGTTIPSQTVPVVFDRDVGQVLLAHTFAMINGENIADGLSMLKGRLGSVIASSLVSIIDDPGIKRGIGSRRFDAEGTPSSRTTVVDRGVLKSYLFDTRSGKKAGFQSTGSAKRDSFRELPSVGGSNFHIASGATAAPDIIGSTDRGLWLISLAGWWVGINPSTGGFSSGAKGLWVENGEVVQPVRNVTIASNVLDMLASVDAVGNDLQFRGEFSSPTFRLSQMKVGGS